MKLEEIKTPEDGKLALDVILIEMDLAGKKREVLEPHILNFYRAIQRTSTLLFDLGRGEEVFKLQEEYGTRYGLIKKQYR